MEVVKSFYNTVVIALGSMSMGIISVYYSPVHDTLLPDLNLSESQGDIFNMMALVFGAVGAIVSKLIVKFTGRRLCVFVTDIATIIFFILLGVTKSNFYFLAFLMRILLGVTMGIFASICSMYIVEIAPQEYRGSLGAFHQLFVAGGNLLDFIFGLFAKWRLLTFLCVLVPVLQVFLLWTVPNSEINEGSTKADSIFQKRYLFPFIHSVIFVFGQQFSGINGIYTNLNQIFANANVSIEPSTASILCAIVSLLATIFSSYAIGKFGRKPMWIVSSFGQTIALGLFAINEVANISNLIPVVGLALYLLFFGLGFGPIPWLIVPELFPDSVRSTFVAIGTALNWTSAGIVAFLYPIVKRSIGNQFPFFLFALVTLLCGIYGIFWMPDTSGKPKDESEDMEIELLKEK